MTESMSVGFDHVALFVADLQTAIGFYANIGFREASRLSLDCQEHVFLELAGSSLRLQLSGPVSQRDPGAGHLALRVEDVDGAHDRLVEQGAQSVERPHDIPAAAARVALVADPDGHQIELIAAMLAPSTPHSPGTSE